VLVLRNERTAQGQESASVSTVAALAIFRTLHCIVAGFRMYIDDLVVEEAARGEGIGSKLLNWLVAEAERRGRTSLSRTRLPSADTRS
jgi:GNAT superfamily N-acetyltransferase